MLERIEITQMRIKRIQCIDALHARFFRFETCACKSRRTHFFCFFYCSFHQFYSLSTKRKLIVSMYTSFGSATQNLTVKPPITIFFFLIFLKKNQIFGKLQEALSNTVFDTL